jgi:hypothetical protein
MSNMTLQHCPENGTSMPLKLYETSWNRKALEVIFSGT